MKYVDEFRDPQRASFFGDRIAELANGLPYTKIMEICGGHTHTIYRYGIEDLLPENVEMVHGPGCPVCVIPMGRIDSAIELATVDNVTLCCFGDMIRVPGDKRNLAQMKAQGCDIRIVYSPLDALNFAKRNPNRQVAFFAVGFETTTPSTALTLVRAKADRVTNFSVHSNHVVIQPPVEALLGAPDVQLQGLLGPGHVATVIGYNAYSFVPEKYGIPIVVSGFEPVDVLESIMMVLAQIRAGRAEVENQYTRAVSADGNLLAKRTMEEVFTLRDVFEWRGLGEIPLSGLALSDAYCDFDAELKFAITPKKIADPKACQCGEVLRGQIKPWQCKVFGNACTPETPIGTCMVSSEGACAAFYNFGKRERDALLVD